MMTRFTLFLILGVLLALATVPAIAQEELSTEETELMEVVQGAIEQFQQLDSVTIEGESSGSSHYMTNLGGADVTFNFAAEATYNGLVQFNQDDTSDLALQVQIISSQSVGDAEPSDTELSVEVIVLGDSQYSNISLGDYSLGWTVNSGEENQVFKIDEFTGTFNKMVDLPVNETTVLSAEELPGETLDGEELRVIHIVFNSVELFKSGILDWLIGTAGIYNGDVDLEALQETFGESAAQEATYWIDGDGLIRRFEATDEVEASAVPELAGPGTVVDYTYNIATTLNYVNFNEPVTIEAPEITS